MSEPSDEAKFAAIVALIGFIAGGFIVWDLTNDYWRARAVRDGKAEWYLDGNADKQWRWKP